MSSFFIRALRRDSHLLNLVALMIWKTDIQRPFRILFISVYFVIISRPDSSKRDLITSQTSTVMFTAWAVSDTHFNPCDYSGVINTLEVSWEEHKPIISNRESEQRFHHLSQSSYLKPTHRILHQDSREILSSIFPNNGRYWGHILHRTQKPCLIDSQQLHSKTHEGTLKLSSA